MYLVKSTFFVVSVFFLSLSTTAFGHGGGGMNNDTCFIDAGSYHFGFVGYQPEEHPKDKFCDTFPSLGSTLLTFDFFQPEIRQMKTGVRILKVVPALLLKEDDQSQTDMTVAEEKPWIHPQGLIILNHEFSEPGHFVAVVTVEDSDGVEHVGRFPFSVAVPITNIALYLIAVGIVLFVTGFVVKRIRSRKYAAA